MKIVVIGAGACGLKAACRARRRDAEAEITVIDAGRYPSLGRCGLPYYVGGIVNELDDLRRTLAGVLRDESYFKRIKNIDVLTETRATEIDRKRKVVKVVRGGKEDEIPYDYLVLATGAKPIKLNLPNADAEGVCTLFDPEDAEKILDMWDEGILERAVIIGGGLIGMETAEALSNLDVEVTIVELLDYVLPALLDREMAMLVQSYLAEKGVKVLTGSRVTEIIAKNGRVAGVKVDGTKEIPADLVLMAVGVRPNVELAKACGLELGETGAIKVNEYLQTSDESIYAGGDCVENVNLVTGKPIYAPLGSTANKHGRVIGDNVTGGRSVFKGVVGTTIFKLFDLNVARTGLTEKQARELGYDVITALCPGPDRAHFMPGQRPIRIKLVADAKTGKLLGAQMVGLGVVDKRIDVVATAIQMGATIDDLASFDLAYAPPYSTAIDTLIHAANVARNKRDGLYKTISSFEVKEKLERGDDFVLLDIRSEEEFRKFKRIEDPRLLRIPLEELRENVDKIPKDKEIVILCQIGSRAYDAQRILEGFGFKDVKVMEGGMAFWFW